MGHLRAQLEVVSIMKKCKCGTGDSAIIFRWIWDKSPIRDRKTCLNRLSVRIWGAWAGLALWLLMAPQIIALKTAGMDDTPAAQWSFEAVQQSQLPDPLRNFSDAISGKFKQVRGIEGQALKFDGFTTVVIREAEQAPRLGGSFTMDAWIALATYPWNWCPILAQESDAAGYAFGIGPQGRLGLRVASQQTWLMFISHAKLPLRKWCHVAVVYEQNSGFRLYVDGEVSGEYPHAAPLNMAPAADLRLGMNRDKVKPALAVPPGAGTLPSWFSLDGILDEVRVHLRCLLPAEIHKAARAPSAGTPPDIPPRIMPSGPPGPGPFGAFYTHLKYYEEWDAQWPVGDFPDVVVRFEGSPVRVVFWRGLRYSPAWVTENGLWLADQSGESGNEEGCVEHMQDIHCLYSHVRIIENTPARAVVHWRYAPVSSADNLWISDVRTGWAWWVDEYYTFYPDGTGVRKFCWRQPEPGCEFPWLQIQETSVLCHPGQNAGDVLDKNALTLLNLKGESHTYSWPDDESPDTRARRTMRPDPSIIRNLEPENPVIQVVNMMAQAHPFVIFEPGNRPLVYVGRVRAELINFPSYNHWPVCQVLSDGRFTQAADRASSFSISQNTPVRHTEDNNVLWVAMLYGATFEPAEKLVPLARSWATPPDLALDGRDYRLQEYHVAQRAYGVENLNPGRPAPFQAALLASAENPVQNMCMVIKNWGEADIELEIDGSVLKKGRDYRLGYVSTLTGSDLVIWIERQATQALSLRVSPLSLMPPSNTTLNEN